MSVPTCKRCGSRLTWAWLNYWRHPKPLCSTEWQIGK